MTLQLVGIISGIIIGSVWEILGTSTYHGNSSLVPSLFVNFFSKNFHLHHWVIYFLLTLLVAVIAYKTDRLFHSSILLILFFLISATVFNILRFPDWYKFL